MSTPTPPDHRLLAFNRDVLSQALALADAHDAPGSPAYAHPVGAHIRHVVEHYEALLHAPEPDVVDYDARPRDAALERSARLARQRLEALLATLSAAPAATLDRPLRVRGLAGVCGDFGFEFGSTLGRELVFAASHAIHHFAVLTPHCQAHGLAMGSHFGKAPATVAHELARGAEYLVTAQMNPQPNEELPCTLSSAAA